MNLKQIKGVVSEQLVITDLLKKGFYVFTPLHRQCPVDIVAISPKGKLHLFDVKTQSIRKSLKSSPKTFVAILILFLNDLIIFSSIVFSAIKSM